MKKSVPMNTTDNHPSKRPNLQIVPKIELKQMENIDVGNIFLHFLTFSHHWLVKWPSYPHWPEILQISNKHIEVIFFGNKNRTAKVKNDRIFDFHSNFDYIIKTLKTARNRNAFSQKRCLKPKYI